MYMVYEKNKEKDKDLKGRKSLLFNGSIKKKYIKCGKMLTTGESTT